MIRLSAPGKPADFPTAAIRAAEAELRRTHGSAETAELWRSYKNLFFEAQHMKCAWCEVQDTSGHGAVDHIAPKKEVASLLRKGREVEGKQGERHIVGVCHQPGYWWRAYEWENWLYSCTICNSTWKHVFFPVEEDPHPAPDPANPNNYTPLLLHPLAPRPAEDPEDHLDFNDDGQILARATGPRGRATIDTLLLDRESLRNAREHHAKNAKTWCDQAISFKGKAQRAALQQLVELGRPEAPHAGLVRAIILRHLHQTWRALHRKFAITAGVNPSPSAAVSPP